MITICKGLLEQVLMTHAPDDLPLTTVVRNGAAEKQAIFDRRHPFASLISSPGSFDSGRARNQGTRLSDGQIANRYVRGERKQPIVVRIWAKAEADADRIIDAVLPHIPRRWRFDNLVGLIDIDVFDASDFASKLSEHYVMGFRCVFTADIALPPGVQPIVP